MDYPLKLSAQLREQLRGLRKARSLTQAELGRLINVDQRRVADIEANPGSVSFDQVMQLLSALGVELVLRDRDPLSESSAESKAGPFTSDGHASISALHEDTAAANEAMQVLRRSAGDLLDAISGHASAMARKPQLLWQPGDPLRLASLYPHLTSSHLIATLAKKMLRSPGALRRHLNNEARGMPFAMDPDQPVPEVVQQWAEALSMHPEALRHAVLLTRQHPLSADTSSGTKIDNAPSKGEW